MLSRCLYEQMGMTESTPPAKPGWPHCGHGADPNADPFGCRGVLVPGHDVCLAHLDDADCAAYLTGLGPGTDIDHRGTCFTPQLLDKLLQATRALDTGHLRLNDAQFSEAT